jgi:LEA14-like dessication related protein
MTFVMTRTVTYCAKKILLLSFCTKFWSFLLLVLLPIGCLVLISGCNGRSVPGGVYATPSVLDLGTVTDKESIEGQFKIVNTNDVPVNIQNVKLFCGCSDLVLSGKIIPANGSVDARLLVDVNGKYGHNMFEAEVFTDEPTVHMVKLQLLANINVKQLGGSIFFDLGNSVSVIRSSGHLRLCRVKLIRCQLRMLNIVPQVYRNQKLKSLP